MSRSGALSVYMGILLVMCALEELKTPFMICMIIFVLTLFISIYSYDKLYDKVDNLERKLKEREEK